MQIIAIYRMFPETLIVCINTHGMIPTDIENNISKPILKKMETSS